MNRRTLSLVITGVALLWTASTILAQGPGGLQILPDGQSFDDGRFDPPKDLNGYFPFTVPGTTEAWEARADELRRRILVANGLWPMPEKAPLNAVVHGRTERDGFTVEKVFFESLPGFYVTGLLFRPAGKDGPFPGVLCPHGHGGRLQDAGEKKVREQITRGEERFEQSGRFPKLARCAQLARMGCVTFIHDMIGYADNTQLSNDLAHRYAKRRPEMEGTDSWGLFSTQAELRCQSIMGLQTWNCIRALDFLCELPDVDASRIGVTGGSGGGTQTILLGAIDERPIVAFPQGMVSTSMQGGCTCENCSLLRIGTGNVELAALFAPRPQSMTTANDWTRDMMTLGFPELRKLYALLGHPDDVECTPYLQFPHNYNYVTRARMYDWFNRYLQLGVPQPIVEEDYKLLSPQEFSVWDDEHPEPAARGDVFERDVVAHLTQQSDRQIAAMRPSDSGASNRFREVVGGAVETILGRTLESVGPLVRTKLDKVDRVDYWRFHDLLAVTDHGEQVLVVSLYPKATDWNGELVVWVTGSGKSGLFSGTAEPEAAVRTLLDRGYAIVTADLFGQGEASPDGTPLHENRTVANPREFAGYTFGYNDTLFAQRVHDVLTLLHWVGSDEHKVRSVHLAGTDGMGPVAAAAGAVSGDALASLAVDIGGFRFRQLTSYRDENFLPGIVKYGDVPALLALGSSQRLLVFDATPSADLVRDAFPGDRLNRQAEADDVPARIVAWLSAE